MWMAVRGSATYLLRGWESEFIDSKTDPLLHGLVNLHDATSGLEFVRLFEDSVMGSERVAAWLQRTENRLQEYLKVDL